MHPENIKILPANPLSVMLLFSQTTIRNFTKLTLTKPRFPFYSANRIIVRRSYQ